MPKPIMSDEYLAMSDFVQKSNLKGVTKSLALCIRNVPFRTDFASYLELKKNDFISFWDKVLEVIDPLEIKIVCPPLVLGALTGCEVQFTNYEQFGGLYHYLQLRRPLASPAQPEPLRLPSSDCNLEQQDRVSPHSSVLFESRPWTSLLLNEGSFVQSYKLQDFYEKEPPSILGDLVGYNWEGVHAAMIPPTIRDFSYIAMFPFSSHIHKLTQCMPRLDRLFTQFVPWNGILEDEVAMKWINQDDLWLERNSCYAYIMRELFNSPQSGNYCYIKEFESGDAADIDGWEMAVEYVKRAGGGWKVEKPGVFVKDTELATKQDKDKKDPETEEGQIPPLLSVPDIQA